MGILTERVIKHRKYIIGLGTAAVSALGVWWFSDSIWGTPENSKTQNGNGNPEQSSIFDLEKAKEFASDHPVELGIGAAVTLVGATAAAHCRSSRRKRAVPTADEQVRDVVAELVGAEQGSSWGSLLPALLILVAIVVGILYYCMGAHSSQSTGNHPVHDNGWGEDLEAGLDQE